MKYLAHETIPYWYGLSFDRKNTSLMVSIHEGCRNVFSEICANSNIVRYFKQEFHFKKFENNIINGFGFDGCIGKSKQSGDLHCINIPLPALRKIIEAPCSACNGTGNEGNEYGMLCVMCAGFGAKTEIRWSEIYSIAASLPVLFEGLFLCDVLASSKNPQLIIVQTIFQKGFHGGSLNGVVDIECAEWLRKHFNAHKQQYIIEAMKCAYFKMSGQIGEFDGRSFKAYAYENGGLHLACPGDACGINSEMNSLYSAVMGYQFHSHNVDSPMQQMTLLCGLAALCDCVQYR